MKIKRGSTSVRRLIFIADSSSTTGAGLTGVAYNSASLVWYYFAGDLSNEVQVTLATATLGTWTSGGFVEVDATNMPGWYEIGIPNAALDGGIECAMQLRGATNMVPVNVYIELDAFDYQTATQPVNVTQFGGTNGTFSSGVPTAALDSSSVTAVQSGLATAAAVQSVKDDTGTTLPAQSTAIYNRLGVPAGASIAADIAGIESGGGGGGDATLANQQLILDRLSETTIGVTGYAQLDIYGVLQLKRGHTATLTFTSSTSNIVSDLSANTTKVFFGIKDAAGRSWLSIEGTKIVNTGLQSVRFTISAALAAAMINGEHFFDVVAVYGYNASTTPKYTSLEPFTSGRAKVTDLYVDI